VIYTPDLCCVLHHWWMSVDHSLGILCECASSWVWCVWRVEPKALGLKSSLESVFVGTCFQVVSSELNSPRVHELNAPCSLYLLHSETLTFLVGSRWVVGMLPDLGVLFYLKTENFTPCKPLSVEARCCFVMVTAGNIYHSDFHLLVVHFTLSLWQVLNSCIFLRLTRQILVRCVLISKF